MVDAWASVVDVDNYTGKTVTEEQLTIAQIMIEGLINRVYRSTDTETKSYYWLRRAVAFQAAYVAAHPDLFNDKDFVSLSQDGFSVSYASGEERTIMYSKIALKLLNNIHHGANTSIRFNSAFQSNKRGSRLSSPGWRPL